jgi:membrane protease subunit HflK
MYMDSIEQLLARSHKVLIDGHAGSNMIYLPIDKLLEKGAAPGESGAEIAGGAPKDQDAAAAEARSRGER